MDCQKIRLIRSIFGLSPRELAKALSVSPYTATRWEAEKGNSPTGLQAEVLLALYNVALTVKEEAALARISALLKLGVGAMLLHLLTNESTRSMERARS